MPLLKQCGSIVENKFIQCKNNNIYIIRYIRVHVRILKQSDILSCNENSAESRSKVFQIK